MKAEKTFSESPKEFQRPHRILLGIGTFFFIYLVIEGIVIVPGLFTRYGWH